MRNEAVNSALVNSLSQERLTKYLASSNGALDRALYLYERNMRLASAFHVPLHCLEISLRNHLHTAMTQKYGADWYVNGKPDLLHYECQIISGVLARLSDARVPASPGPVIAELSFGFWVSMLGRGYDAGLWRETLSGAFSRNGRRLARQEVHGRMNAVRRFRNRVAHYETIYDRPVLDLHAEIIEAIGWMCSRTAKWAAFHSQVPSVIAGA